MCATVEGRCLEYLVCITLIRGLDFMTNFFGSLWSDFGFDFGGIFKVNFVVNLGGDFGVFLAKMH